MRSLKLLFLLGWLGASMITGAEAAGSDLSMSGLCKVLESRLKQCGNGQSSAKKWVFCDPRIEDGYQALCGARIYVSSAAMGDLIDLLSEDYTILPIEDENGDVFPHHLVIGPSDLDDPHVIALLRASHQAGKTVAIVHATQDQARSFHRLVRPGQEANCAPPKGQTRIALYGLQQSVTRIPSQFSSYCLGNLDLSDAASDRRWLIERFGPTPPQPTAGIQGTSAQQTSSSANQTLTDLATAMHCSYKGTDGYNNPSLGDFEEDLYVYTMRDFSDTGCSSCQNPGADYYLVQLNGTFLPALSNLWDYAVSSAYNNQGPATASGAPLNFNLMTLLLADPQTVKTYESSYTNGSSATTSDSVGFNSNGVSSVTEGSSTTTSHSQTYSVPATTIVLSENISNASALWNFETQAKTLPEFSVNPTWTWYIPRDAYPNGGAYTGQIRFGTDMKMYYYNTAYDFNRGYCYIDQPFTAWTVAPPQLSSVQPTSTTLNGGQFTITGQYLYPGSVTAVLIGGQAVPLGTNVDVVNDTTIVVTVGGLTLSAGSYPVQVNTQYNGQNRFSNIINIKLTN